MGRIEELQPSANEGQGFLLTKVNDGDADHCGLHLELRRIEVPSPDGPVPMVTVRDPDGVLVEIIGPPQRSRK